MKIIEKKKSKHYKNSLSSLLIGWLKIFFKIRCEFLIVRWDMLMLVIYLQTFASNLKIDF
jgi:hypothetical protein